MDNPNNRAYLCGELGALPVFSHENHGRQFWQFPLLVERLSGTIDTVQVLVAQDVLAQCEVREGSRIAVSGQIRSFNSRRATGRRLVITVYAEVLELCDCEPENEVELVGTICKPPVFRRTPLGREICDVMLAVGRTYRRTDYLPCILWGRTAEAVGELPVGAQLRLVGRLQSREYIKVLESGSEKRVAYEISAVSAEEVSPEQLEAAGVPESPET